MKKKYLILGSITLIALVGLGSYLWYVNYKVPYNEAISNFQSAKKKVETENDKLTLSIDSAQEVLNSKEVPYNQETFTNLQSAISEARESIKTVPELPSKTEEIIKEVTFLNEPIDYSEHIQSLDSNRQDALNSITQYKQIINPNEDFVIDRIKQIDQIEDFQAVTEDNDPNGNLNKQGGYTATVFFSSKNVNQKEVFGGSLIEKGTLSGGSIEVYPTIEDAENRELYLASFDSNNLMKTGSHAVLGTIVIRTSHALKASQQKELESEIIDKLIELK